ncbi:hypothetical protein CCP4SC76_5300017 [Gammaproteobacteria bacterium]
MTPEDVRNGVMVSLADITLGGSDIPGRWDVHYGRFEADGRAFLTDVLFCPNPTCDCQAVHPYFLEIETFPELGGMTLHDRLLLMWRFNGRTEVMNNNGLPQGTVDQLIAAWRMRHTKDLPQFQKDYEKIRQVGKRSLMEQSTPIDFPRTIPRLGRNDPCFCGSGKKYKKCCGGREGIFNA